MNRREFIKAGTTLAMAPAILTRAQSPQVIDPAPPRLPAAGADGWVSLLNGRDLSGWYTMLQRSGKGVAEEQRMILMEEEMLHIMGNEEGKFPAEGGYLATNQEFANVRIRVEYKWGVKRHAPRYTPKRDNGLLYGLVGPDRVWPSCVECQIEEGDVGDFFLLGGVRGVQSNHNAGLFGEGINPLTGWPQPGDPGFRGAGAATCRRSAGCRSCDGSRRCTRSRCRSRSGRGPRCSAARGTDQRPLHQGWQLRAAGSVEYGRGHLAGRSRGAHRQRPHRECRDAASAARSAESRAVHPAHAREDRDRDRIRGDLVQTD